MPVCGLPPALESMLNSLVGENKLTSWRISGERDFIGVSLRFHSIANGGTGVIGEHVYRSKPPSQVSRDKQRRNNWYVNKNSIQQQESAKRNNSFDKSDDTNVAKLGSEQNQSTITGSRHSMSNVLITSDDITLTQSPHSSGQDTKGHDMGQSESEVVNEPSHYPCDECRLPIPTKSKTICYTCTHCEDFAICTECNDKGTHNKHSDQLHKFVIPDIDDNVYCRCCGHVFRTNQNKLYQCTACNDGYILCLKCHNEGMHRKHLYNQELMTRKSYLS